MIRKFIDSISTETLLRIAYIPGALIVHLLWLLLVGHSTGVLICIQAPLLAIQIAATVIWMRRR
jgi:hypothetical protein